MNDAPNDTELLVLKHLWKAGRQSAREIHLAIGEGLDWKPSTTRTLVNRMEAKGFLARESVHGLAVFAPGIEKVPTLAQKFRDLAEGLLELPTPVPASFFADSPLLSDVEAAEMEALIKRLGDAEETS